MTIAFVLALLAWIVTLGAWYYRLRMTEQLRASSIELSLAVSALMNYLNSTEFRVPYDQMDQEGALEIRTGPDGVYIKKHPLPDRDEAARGLPDR